MRRATLALVVAVGLLVVALAATGSAAAQADEINVSGTATAVDLPESNYDEISVGYSSEYDQYTDSGTFVSNRSMPEQVRDAYRFKDGGGGDIEYIVSGKSLYRYSETLPVRNSPSEIHGVTLTDAGQFVTAEGSTVRFSDAGDINSEFTSFSFGSRVRDVSAPKESGSDTAAVYGQTLAMINEAAPGYVLYDVGADACSVNHIGNFVFVGTPSELQIRGSATGWGTVDARISTPHSVDDVTFLDRTTDSFGYIATGSSVNRFEYDSGSDSYVAYGLESGSGDSSCMDIVASSTDSTDGTTDDSSTDGTTDDSSTDDSDDGGSIGGGGGSGGSTLLGAPEMYLLLFGGLLLIILYAGSRRRRGDSA